MTTDEAFEQLLSSLSDVHGERQDHCTHSQYGPANQGHVYQALVRSIVGEIQNHVDRIVMTTQQTHTHTHTKYIFIHIFVHFHSLQTGEGMRQYWCTFL